MPQKAIIQMNKNRISYFTLYFFFFFFVSALLPPYQVLQYNSNAQ